MNNLSDWKRTGKFSGLTGNRTLTFAIDQKPHSIHCANQANWKAGYCELVIYPMVERTWYLWNISWMVRAVSSRMYTLQAEPLVVFLIDEASSLARSLRDLMHWSSLRSLLRTYESSKSREKEALSASRQAFEVTAAQTSGLVNLVSSRQTGFIECEHLFIDKPMVIKEPAVASARL